MDPLWSDQADLWHLSQGKWHWQRRGKGNTWHRSQAVWHFSRVRMQYLVERTMEKYRHKLIDNIGKSNLIFNRIRLTNR